MDSNEDRFVALEKSVIEVALSLRAAVDTAEKCDLMTADKLKQEVTDLKRSIAVTDIMLMLLCKESGIPRERFEEIVEAATGHVVAKEMADDMPPEIKEALDELIANLQAGDEDCVKH